MKDARPRTIVTTDPEVDDANSLVRLLLYSNEIEIQGLVYAGSRFHWAGDGKGSRFFHVDREYSAPQTSWRWGPDDSFIGDVVDRYAEVEDNLRAHDARYPPADGLRSVIRRGNVDFEGDDISQSAGADLIAHAMLDDDPRPLFVQLWAGPATLSRALRTLEERFRTDTSWSAIKERLSRRVIVMKFASQDDTYEDYIAAQWPDIQVRDVAIRMWTYAARTVAGSDGLPFLSADWHRENVTSRGPLGAHYRVWGDGRAMPGDHFDYFGTRKNAEQLRAEGVLVFTPVQEPGSWISEGDTTTFLNLIDNGLRAHEDPRYGGWGGRQWRNPHRRNEYLAEPANPFEPNGIAPARQVAARWFPDAQRDFAARLRWSTTADRSAVNHPPRIHLRTPVSIAAKPGESVELHANVDDPDGDAVRVRWREDTDAADGVSSGFFEEPCKPSTRFLLSTELASGVEVYLLLEARDDGEPSLVRYARVVVTVE